MLMRFDPFRGLDRLVDETSWFRSGPFMPMDAYRHGDHVTVHLDLPGVDPDSLDITVEKNQLTVTAQRRWEREDDTQVLASERPQGSFSRSLFLGDAIDADGIDANYEDGVLTITLPVAEAAKARKISVGHRQPELTA